MIKLFKKIRRKIWDWRIDKLKHLYVEHWKIAYLLFEVVLYLYKPILEDRNVTKTLMRKCKISMKRLKHHQHLCDKYWKKIQCLQAKINGQK